MLAFRSLAGTLFYCILPPLERVVDAVARLLDCRCKCVSSLRGFLTQSSNDDTELPHLNVRASRRASLASLHVPLADFGCRSPCPKQPNEQVCEAVRALPLVCLLTDSRQVRAQSRSWSRWTPLGAYTR